MTQDARGYWIWLGPLVDDDTMITRAAVSTAATRWQSGLLGAVVAEGQRILVISYVPEPAWPRGDLTVPASGSSRPNLDVVGVGYLNLPAIRESSLRAHHLSAVRRVLAEKGAPAALLSYNASKTYVKAAGWLKEKCEVPWVPVLLDPPTRPDDVPLYEHRLRTAAARVFLSWGSYASWQGSVPRLHLDGGVREVRHPTHRQGHRAILYAGSLSPYGGADFLAEAFRHLDSPDLELWICGKGSEAQRRALGSLDQRIKVFGVVSERTLEELSERASVFANPRPSERYITQGGFPSKVLEYLSYCKPVVSTWASVFSEDYGAVLLTPEDESPGAFASCLQRALDMPLEEREALRRTVSGFLEGKLWRVQARRLIDWVRAEVLA